MGRSGGLLTIWRKDVVEVLSSFKGEGFLGIHVQWKNHLYYVVNIYSPCDLSRKKILWNDLLACKESFKDGEWIMGGDFNAIKNCGERKGRGVVVNHRESNLFSEFILKSELVDIPCKGNKFSWFSGDGNSMSRIDRFLLSSNVVDRWKIIGQLIGDRDISDHCPIWLMKDNSNWGPKPFRFNNEWFSLGSFVPFVEKEWKSLKVEGRGDFVLKEKLRLFKDKLRSWNKEVFGKIDLEMEEGVRDMNNADERLVSRFHSSCFDDNLILRNEACSKFWRNLRIKENMILQKSRCSWIKEGDANSSFFYKVMKQRRNHNHIGPLFSSGVMIDSVDGVKDTVFNHFERKFVETEEVRPLLEGIPFNCISREEADGLERPFLERGIKEAVVAKLLPGRLKGVLNSIISSCQSAFVPGRQLLDGVLVANDVVDYAKKEETLRKSCVSRGLRQGDPLSPFLFVIVAEGLSGLIRKSIEVGEFQRFTIKGSCCVDVLQFADDTLIIEDGNWKHVWALKAVLRAFELVFGLGINYHKSKLIGINTNRSFLEAASFLLSCKVEDPNFYFLGIPIGFNPRKEATWNPLLSKMKNRLKGWMNRSFNLGGRITLLKSVLCSLTIFTMSFYRMPKKVVKIFKALQSKFLWEVVEEKRRIHWVKWEEVTLPFEKMGLGVKNIELFNLALLNKWRWRILQGLNGMWLDVLKARYGDISSLAFCGGKGFKVLPSCSFWCKDLIKVSSSLSLDPIVECSKFSINNGFITPFWESNWLNDTPLQEAFPVLYEFSSLKKVSVAAMGGWLDGVWI
ncbi:uncharacterized protein LOC131632631 [Vicia villosa]|uniref:uncharacterized protein LOC131632631 n=1 Tax=Vicia villosa TaxID=3911 RepID=UPI00273B4437|nr:uncharacterized protein LOC131632631 [Vicia villosa]